jgi:DNA-binding CsgD family transcriptional regulator
MAEEPGIPAWRRPWDALDRGLVELRGLRDPEELAERACSLAMGCCGSDHVALGRIRDDVWSPWKESGGGSSAVAFVPRAPIALEELPTEREVVRTGETLVRPGPPVGTAVAPEPEVIVAGVRSAGQVVGLLHVATGASTDLMIVAAYADALSSMLALLDVRRRVGAQARVLGGLSGAVDELRVDVPIELVPDPRAIAPGPLPADDPDGGGVRDRLTARQREVLDLMLAGQTNAQIADRLVLSIPTVKSHVRAVLRAVGAVNRSEAIARVRRGSGPRPRA